MSGMKAAKAKADRLFSIQIRSLGECEAGGSSSSRPLWRSAGGYLQDCSPKLECAHWISRRYAWTRTWADNAFCLCSAHHRWFTANPTEFGRWAISVRGEDIYQSVRVRSLRRDKFDWQVEVERLMNLPG